VFFCLENCCFGIMNKERNLESHSKNILIIK